MNLAPPGTTTMLTRCGDTRGECARSISLRLAQLKHLARREATELDRVARLQVGVLIYTHTFEYAPLSRCRAIARLPLRMRSWRE
jgi:hypothetical protein